MSSTDSVYSNDKLKNLLHRRKLKDVYESLNPSVSSYMNIVSSDEQHNHIKPNNHSSTSTNIDLSNIDQSGELDVKKSRKLLAKESSRSGDSTSRSTINSRVFSRSATTVMDSETESIEQAGVSMISNFHRIASLAARASEANSARSGTNGNNSQRSAAGSGSFDGLKLLNNIANQQACSHVYKYKLQVTCDFQAMKPANYFLFTTIPIRCQFSSIKFERQVPIVDPHTKRMTNCTMKFKILHGKLDKVSNKYAEAVYVFTSKMINLFENGFHKVLFSAIKSGKARIPGKNFYRRNGGNSNRTKLPHIKRNGEIDYNVLMAQFSDNIEVAYNHWTQQFRSNNKTHHARQHKLLNDFMIVPARENFEQTDWVHDEDLMKNTFHKIFNKFENTDWEEGLSLGDDMLLYQESRFLLPTQLLRFRKTKIREISYKIPLSPRKHKRKSKSLKQKLKSRRKSTGDCQQKNPVEYKTITFKIPRPIKNVQTDVPMIKGYQLDDESKNQEKTILLESDEVLRVNLRSLQLRALQNMTSFFEDLSNVEDITMNHLKHHVDEKKISIEKQLIENFDIYTNTMSNDDDYDDDRKERNNDSFPPLTEYDLGVTDFSATTMGASTMKFLKKDVTMWQRRKEARLNKFNSAINFNVVRSNVADSVFQAAIDAQRQPVRSRLSTVARSSATTPFRKSVVVTPDTHGVMPERMIAMSKCNSSAKLAKVNTHDYVFDRIMRKVAAVFSHLAIDKMDKNTFKLLMNRVITIRQHEKAFKQNTTNGQRNRKNNNNNSTQQFHDILDQVVHHVKTGSSQESKESNSKVLGTFHRPKKSSQKSSLILNEMDEARSKCEALLNRNMAKYEKIYEKFFAAISNSKNKSFIEPQQIASVIRLGCNTIDAPAINFMLQWFQFTDADTTENGLKRTGTSAAVTFGDCFAAHLQNVHLLFKNDFFVMHHELERQAKIASYVNNQPRNRQRYEYEPTSVDQTLEIDASAKLMTVKEESRQSSRYQHFLTARRDYNPVSSNNTTVEMHIRPVDKTSILVRYCDLSHLENNQQQQFDALLWLAVVFDCQELVNQPIFEEWKRDMLSCSTDDSGLSASETESQESTSEMVVSDLDAVLTSSEFKETIIANHLNLQYFDHFRTTYLDDMFDTLFQVFNKHGQTMLTSRYLQWFFEELCVDVMKLEYGVEEEEENNGTSSSSSSISSSYSFEKCLNAAFDFYDTQNRQIITSSDLMIFENSHLRNVFAPDLDKMFKFLFSEHFDQLVTSKDCGITRQQFYSLFEKENSTTGTIEDSITHQAIKKFNVPECCKVFDKS